MSEFDKETQSVKTHLLWNWKVEMMKGKDDQKFSLFDAYKGYPFYERMMKYVNKVI